MSSEIISVGMFSLGCTKNQVDAERMLYFLRSEGFEIKSDPALCDVAIVNTCGFIESAKQESIDSILELATLKSEGRIRVIAVTGCLAERYRDEVAKEIPEVDIILGIGSNADIANAIREALKGQKVQLYGDKENLSLEGDRILVNHPYYSYIKVAEGCDNCCTYCAIPMIRGRFRSRRIEHIVAEAKALSERGITEMNIIAQDTTRYGDDLYGKLMLPELLRQLCEIDGIHWIRLLYCYPERVTDELLDLMATEPKILKYMDLPIQHSSGRVLSKMNRPGDRDQLATLINHMRDRVPGITLRTTLIAGFPGETEEEFADMCEFVKEMKFDRLGCFAYSQEEDTAAAEMDGQLDEETKAERADIIMRTQMDVMAQRCEDQIGRTLEVLVEGYDRLSECWFGRSIDDAPDIDTKTFFTTTQPVNPGEYVNVLIDDYMDVDLLGERV